MTICDIMNSIESNKIMLSEIRQLLHITLVTSATAERTFSAMHRYLFIKGFALPQLPLESHIYGQSENLVA